MWSQIIASIYYFQVRIRQADFVFQFTSLSQMFEISSKTVSYSPFLNIDDAKQMQDAGPRI